MLTIYCDGECIVVEGLHRTFDGEVCSRLRSALDDEGLAIVVLRGAADTVSVGFGTVDDDSFHAFVGALDAGQIPWPVKVRSAYEHENPGTVYVEVDCDPDVVVTSV